MDSDYARLDKILLYYDDSTGKFTHSLEERQSAARELAGGEINLSALSIAHNYRMAYQAGDIPDPHPVCYDNPEINQMMKCVWTQNVQQFRGFSSKERVERIAQQVLAKSVELDEQLSKKEVEKIIYHAEIITGNDPAIANILDAMISPMIGRKPKPYTLREILEDYKNREPDPLNF